ncbi:pyridoxamine 5'-phosphate oxidase family protein [Ammoniphilus sp. 3BR4]|uniref:pyridoxamine 5'-phosphate oxidase family protein n=1 Tax=Ammoniphilus sp. 3BR4 TaxID=3158265 RepID=UPI0034659A55
MSRSQGETILQKMYGTQNRATTFYNNQILNYLNPMMIDFISEQEMVFISTSDRKGNCDSSFRSGEAGFVRVIDNHTVMYPEYRGNGVYASLGNIYDNPHIGLLFIDFFTYCIGLHVNGQATIIENRDLINHPLINENIIEEINHTEGTRAERWVVIKIEEAYIHCSKHIPLLRKVNKEIYWGTDDERHKGGDFFKAKNKK